VPPSQKVSGERNQFSARLISVLESVRGLQPSPTVIAREFNNRFGGKPVTVHAVRKWLVGEAIPTQDKLRALAKWLEVSVEWLRFGGSVSQMTNLSRRDLDLQSSPQEQIIQLFLSLPARERKLAQDFVAMLSKKNVRIGPAQPAMVENLSHH